jgi:hypothetical protein
MEGPRGALTPPKPAKPEREPQQEPAPQPKADYRITVIKGGLVSILLAPAREDRQRARRDR